ncbi:MAG TPA: glycogen-binding domain-containing protein [bacterium]
MKLLAANAGKLVQFALKAEPTNRVFVAGTFNNWDPGANPLQGSPDSGYFTTALHVPTGRHEYKFVVDGAWVVDPACPDCVPNAFGSTNSVLRV